MFVRKSLPETTILLHRETVEKHGSHNQASHGRRGGGGGGGGGASKVPSVGRDNVGYGIQEVLGLTDEKIGKMIDSEAKQQKNDINDLIKDFQTKAESAKDPVDLKYMRRTVTNLQQASRLAEKVPSIKSPKGKLDQLERVIGKLETADETTLGGRAAQTLQRYLEDSIDFVYNYREGLANLKG